MVRIIVNGARGTDSFVITVEEATSESAIKSMDTILKSMEAHDVEMLRIGKVYPKK